MIGNTNANYNDLTLNLDKEFSIIGDGLTSIIDYGIGYSNYAFSYSTKPIIFYRLKVIAGQFFRNSTTTINKWYNCVISMGIGVAGSSSATIENRPQFYNCIFDQRTTQYGINRGNCYMENCIILGKSNGWSAYGDENSKVLKTTLNNDLFIDYNQNCSSLDPTTTFSSFTLTGFTSALEVGDSIPTSKIFTWATTNNSNIQPNSIRIIDVTNSNNPIASNLANDGTETVSTTPITKNVASSHTFRIEGTNTNSVTFNRTININWQFKVYSGESTDAILDESKIKLLRLSNITSSSGIAKTYNFNTGGYKYIVYPASYGTLSEFKDQSTNLDIPMENSYLVSVTNTFGIETNYRVHRTTNIINGSIDIIAG